MCGICGAIALEGQLDPAVGAAVGAMASAMAHRGPDGEGVFRDAFAALGHRRLAIIDVAGGAQPLGNEDGSVQVVFNGEIYNHHEIRRTLVARGHRFRTASDTETIVHLYEEYGPACVDHLDGMFAFAVYDQPGRELFLARDRLGKKPLFYGRFGTTLLFASEIKSLAASPVWDGTLDLSSLESYLTLGYFPAPSTPYRQVRKLLPAHSLLVRGGHLRDREYWDVPSFGQDRRDEQAVVEHLEQLLRDAVRDRLESEVPLGAFLSGGIDSGLVASFMTEAASGPVVTTTVGFAERAYDESDAAAVTAAHLGTAHFADRLALDFDAVLDPVLDAFDEPFADASAIPTYWVSRAARQHVTVALSGDGGDETFSGYDFRYVPHVMESGVRRWTRAAAGRAAVRAVARAWPRSPALPRPLRLGPIADNLLRDPADAYFVDLCFVKPASAAHILGRRRDEPLESHPAHALVTSAYRRCASDDALQRAQYADLKIYMPNGPLVKVDRMSMLNSLEVRCPFLDRRVVEFAFNVPSERKMPRLRGKHLLRQLAARRLPPGIAGLPKRGFAAPVGPWLASRGAGRFSDEMFARDAASSMVFDIAEVRRRFDEHRHGLADHTYLLWAVWVFEHWMRAQRQPARAVA